METMSKLTRGYIKGLFIILITVMTTNAYAAYYVVYTSTARACISCSNPCHKSVQHATSHRHHKQSSHERNSYRIEVYYPVVSCDSCSCRQSCSDCSCFNDCDSSSCFEEGYSGTSNSVFDDEEQDMRTGDDAGAELQIN